ncbi:hypothetical protein PLICRDRAFT_113667 [Plicaturopsis crispa FD-325 SS-3]|nr:hypothetical protein PLICRDRAFT_113667 [Plicaturopsis crispa FD-325 SS-3]
MSQPVKLYVYDLSNGMARQLSRQLTGRQIDGIWHTSVVVFGKEVFYGQGISITQPGKSHHGAPLQVVDMGETALDEETFDEYLNEMREHYTADKYHLLDFNCNSFTNDCIGFLTGGSIPPFIKDLPADFLSTPFGAALRPTIDNMYRRPAPGAAPATPSTAAASASPNPQLASALLQAVASRAATNPTPTPATQTLTAPIHLSTNPSSLRSLLHSHRALVAFFTAPDTCPPCRVIEPVFEGLAREKAREGLAFSKTDLNVGMGGSVAGEWGVRVTPTFIFFLDGKKIHELKGADANELRTQVDLLLFQAFPPHPHASLPLRATQSISLAPILFTQVPPFDTVLAKLVSSIHSSPSAATLSSAQSTLENEFIPFLKSSFSNPPPPHPPRPTPSLLANATRATAQLADALPPAQLFPLADLWRLAVLNADSAAFEALSILLAKASDAGAGTRNYVLTVLRLLANAFSSAALAGELVGGRGRAGITDVLVPALLHEDAAVRTAAASLAFNVAAYLHKGRHGGGKTAAEGDGDWEVELGSAIVEAIGREKGSEEVVHRLTASLALLLRLSPYYETHHAPLLEVLQTREVLKSKVEEGGVVKKKEVKALVEEVAGKLCP